MIARKLGIRAHRRDDEPEPAAAREQAGGFGEGREGVVMNIESCGLDECLDRFGKHLVFPGQPRFELLDLLAEFTVGVFQFDTTTVITPGWEARVDEFFNLWLAR